MWLTRWLARSPAVLRAMHDLLPELGARGRNGVTLMRAYLKERPPGTRTPTGLERKYERILEDGNERPMARQVDLGGHEWLGRVDYYDRDLAMIVEIQSETFHTSFLDESADEARVHELLGSGFAAVLLVPEVLVWYRPRDLLEGVRLARAALTSGDPRRFVPSIRKLGLRFEVTKRGLGGGAGRMSA